MNKKEQLIYLICNDKIKNMRELDDLYYNDMDDKTKAYYYDMIVILTNKFHIKNSGLGYNTFKIMKNDIKFKYKLIQDRRNSKE